MRGQLGFLAASPQLIRLPPTHGGGGAWLLCHLSPSGRACADAWWWDLDGFLAACDRVTTSDFLILLDS